MSHRAGLEMLCTSDLQAEELMAERADGGSSKRAQSRPEEADGVRRGRKTQNSRGRDARRATGILLVSIFNDRSHRADRTQRKFRLLFAELAGRKHSSVCAQVP